MSSNVGNKTTGSASMNSTARNSETSFKPKRSGFKVMLGLIGMVKPLAGYMVLAIVMGIIGFLTAIFITVFGAVAILDVLGVDKGISSGVVFACVLIFALVRGVLRYAEQSCNHFIAFKLLALIRDKVFFALRKLCPAKLEGRNKGDLISVITSDIELLEVFYAHTISPTVIAFVVSIIMCIFIGQISWILAAVALTAYVVIGLFVPVYISKAGKDIGFTFRSKSGELSSFVLDSLRGLPEILQYNCGKERLAEMNTRTDELSEEEKKLKSLTGFNTAITNTIILIFDVLMIAVSCTLCNNGTISFAGALVATVSLMSSFGPVIALANLGSTLQNTFAAGNRVLDILDESPVTVDVTDREEVEFEGAATENVTFAYDSETILKNVSIPMPKGSIIGIQGRSGSGKSTLLKLLMRFWSTDEGIVKVSGRSVDEINTDNLRDMESFVTQDTHLFNDTIKNNIRIAKQDATDEEIEQACRKASIHDFIAKLPNGYDTNVGELGDMLSGGEKQRIGLARAFLHDAPFILLDEPTSNLDSLNEAIILKSLREEDKGRTVVLVSHRQSTMRIADKIYSIEHGRVS